jgi:signal transduction histidine kinase
MEMSNSSQLNRLANVALRLNGRFANQGFRLNGNSSPAKTHDTWQADKSTLMSTQLEKEALETKLREARQSQAEMQQRIVALEAKVEEQAQQIQEMDTYAYTVAHGLKTPLSVITFASEMLIHSEAAGAPDPDAPELLSSIFNMGNKMARIIEDLLTLTGISQAEVVSEPLEMGQILWEVNERVASKVEHSGADITLAAPVETWPIAKGSRPLVEEIWDNFISNAIKYGGDPPEIQLGAERVDDNTIRFWIRDNGHGIPMSTQNRLFKAFNRMHVNLADGHGLGLAIVDRIVRKLGGRVAVESSGIPGEGSIFSFTLPAAETQD